MKIKKKFHTTKCAFANDYAQNSFECNVNENRGCFSLSDLFKYFFLFFYFY